MSSTAGAEAKRPRRGTATKDTRELALAAAREALKKKARELTRIVEEGGGFDATATHWREVDALFEAVREGSREWGVPQYNGMLFTTDPSISPEGAVLVKSSTKGYGAQRMLVHNSTAARPSPIVINPSPSTSRI